MKLASVKWMSPYVAGGVTVAWVFVAVDYATRRDWDGVSRPLHLAAALLLFTAVGTVVSLGGAGVAAAHRVLVTRLSERHARWVPWLAPLIGAGIGLGTLGPAAFIMFSGARVSGTPLHTFGPPSVLLALAAIGALWARSTLQAFGAAGARRPTFLLAFVAFALAAGAALIWADMTIYVSLYARLHTALETVAELIIFTGVTAVLARHWASGGKGTPWLERAAVVFVAVTLGFVAVPPLRSWVDDALRHAWRHPVYVGRMLSRAQIVDGFVRDPRGWRGATMSSVVRLRERYDIATTKRSPVWNAPYSEPPEVASPLSALRGGRQYNVVFFYVDTLRADTARNPLVMPNTVELSRASVDFRRAYTTGSDTLHALPGLLRGRYDLFSEEQGDMVSMARAAGSTSVLTVAQSAREFLSRLLPQFRLDTTLEVSDYAPGNENVWGYGADRPTASRLTDQALGWLRQHGRERPFFLWLFHFDVHNWRELDLSYLRQLGRQSGLLDEADPVWRYRVVARSVDHELGRFLAGIAELGLDKDTIVVFVSDHGEALGREGFWVHSVFLWEELVHVPLILRVPGLPPARVDDVVSLVDVAPTLAGYMRRAGQHVEDMEDGVPDAQYHGQDLLRYLLPEHTDRRLPIVMMSTMKEVPVRIGLIEPSGRYKLVLPLEGAVPELYDLRAPDPDANDVGPENEGELLRLLNETVQGPLFPRVGEAGSGPLDEAAREGQIAIIHDARVAREAQQAKEAQQAREAQARAEVQAQENAENANTALERGPAAEDAGRDGDGGRAAN